MKTIVSVLFLVSLICASCTTTYVAESTMGGYSDQDLGDSAYTVAFRGNGYTSAQTAWNFFLTRAAEIAIENGYSAFYVLDVQNISRTSEYVTPGYSTSHTTTTINGSFNTYGSLGFYNGTASSTTTTMYTPPRAYSITKPGFEGRILLVNKRLDKQPIPYDARVTYNMGKELAKKVESQNAVVTVVVIGGSTIALIIAGGSH